MRPAFHPAATFFGYAGGSLVSGIETLYAWIDGNGPVAGLETRIANVDIVESIAVVRLEGSGWSGVLAGPGPVHITDVLTLLREPEGGWRILQKVFHWHAAI